MERKIDTPEMTDAPREKMTLDQLGEYRRRFREAWELIYSYIKENQQVPPVIEEWVLRPLRDASATKEPMPELTQPVDEGVRDILPMREAAAG